MQTHYVQASSRLLTFRYRVKSELGFSPAGSM